MWHKFYSSGADHTAPVQVANEKVSEDHNQEQQQEKRAQRHASGKDGEATAVDAGTARNKCHVLGKKNDNTDNVEVMFSCGNTGTEYSFQKLVTSSWGVQILLAKTKLKTK